MKPAASRLTSSVLFLGLSLLALSAPAQLLIQNVNFISAYNFNGSLINSNYIAGLSEPQGIVIQGPCLYIVNHGVGTTNGVIGKYNLDGTPLNALLITNLTKAEGIAISGSNLYISSYGGGVSLFNTNGAAINRSLVPAATFAIGDAVAVSGSNLFLFGGSQAGKFNLNGSVITQPLITGLSNAAASAIFDGNIYIPDEGSGQVGKYNLDGSAVNASLISGLTTPNGIAINGNILYVLCGAKVGAYGLDGAAINPSLITNLIATNGVNYGIVVMPPPSIVTNDSAFGIKSNHFGFNCLGISNQTVVVETAANLSTPSWIPLQTNVLLTNSFYFYDPTWTNHPVRYYRVRPL